MEVWQKCLLSVLSCLVLCNFVLIWCYYDFKSVLLKKVRIDNSICDVNCELLALQKEQYKFYQDVHKETKTLNETYQQGYEHGVKSKEIDNTIVEVMAKSVKKSTKKQIKK